MDGLGLLLAVDPRSVPCLLSSGRAEPYDYTLSAWRPRGSGNLGDAAVPPGSGTQTQPSALPAFVGGSSRGIGLATAASRRVASVLASSVGRCTGLAISSPRDSISVQSPRIGYINPMRIPKRATRRRAVIYQVSGGRRRGRGVPMQWVALL